jgi:hypothetical protein
MRDLDTSTFSQVYFYSHEVMLFSEKKISNKSKPIVRRKEARCEMRDRQRTKLG